MSKKGYRPMSNIRSNDPLHKRSDSWGPFRPGVPADERRAQLRELRALLRVLAGPASHDAADALSRAAEQPDDPERLRAALAAIEQLRPKPRRNVLASFARLHWPGGAE
jgi:hypothetical protein